MINPNWKTGGMPTQSPIDLSQFMALARQYPQIAQMLQQRQGLNLQGLLGAISHAYLGNPGQGTLKLGADLNQSGNVDLSDMLRWKSMYQQGDMAADLNKSGKVDLADLMIFKQQMNQRA